MKTASILKVTALAIPMLLTSCHTSKTVTNEPKVSQQVKTPKSAFLEKVDANSVKKESTFVSSKLKFSVELGAQQVTLTGNLRMKRDSVIRLQLMAFGFVEAARLEFTPNYVLIMDRMNKQYLKVPYSHVDFLRHSGINFYTLQALFWNELFVPGAKAVTNENTEKFVITENGEESIINLEDGKMNYSWLANTGSGRIKMANIAYRDLLNGNTQLNWEYETFGKLVDKLFPTGMNVTVTTPEKEVKLNMKLSYLGNESDWELQTKVSDKYREVTVDEILHRFMSL
jgi:hypothetical protein